MFGKANASNNIKDTLHNSFFVGYSYSLASIDKSSGFFYSMTLSLNEVQFINSKLFYGIQMPINSKYSIRLTQYLKYFTFADLTNSIQSSYVGYITDEHVNRIVTDFEFGLVRRLKIRKTNLNIGLSYRWFFIGSEYSFTYHYPNGSIEVFNLNYNFDGASLSLNYVNHNVELGFSFHIIPENHHNFPAVTSKIILIPELKGIYIL